MGHARPLQWVASTRLDLAARVGLNGVGKGDGDVARLSKAQLEELIGTGSTEGVTDGLFWTQHPGLYVQVRRGKASWCFRYNQKGRNRTAGLGSWDKVPYLAACTEATRLKAIFDGGGDPIEVRRAEREGRDPSTALASSGAPSFRRAARAFLEFAAPGWKDGRTELGWARRLHRFVYPALADRPVDTITPEDIADTVRPIWHDKNPTARTTLGNLRQIFEYAVARDWCEDNPAASPKVAVLLGGAKRHIIKHRRALDAADVPACWEALVAEPGEVAACLRLVVLTVVRSAVARGVDWSEIDMGRALWTVPGSRTKTGREHRVPLAPAALELLEAQGPRATGPVFIGRAGRPLAETSMTRLLTRLGVDATVHGFRSSFTEWARERGGVEREVIEAVLAHVEPSATIRAYHRTDLLQRRREALEGWAAFVTGSAR